MGKHRADRFKRQWWQRKQYLVHLVHYSRIWFQDQVTELKDIAAELKERNK